MNVRNATPDDLATLEGLWKALKAEVPPPAHEDVDPATELAEIRAIVDSGLGWVAERAGSAIGIALALRRGERVGRITGLYVVPAERRTGVADSLVRAVAARLAEDGVETIDLEVMASNSAARAVSARWGFRDEVLVLASPVTALVERLGVEAPTTSFGSIHVQTDDADVILKAVEMFVPRLLGRSTGSIVTQPRTGYVTVYDDACDRDPAMLRRLAKEISARTGLVVIAIGVEQEALVRMILFDRGGIVDEYASVPEFHGSLPPGEVVALNANPVVVERYTGAAQAAVRAAAPVARVPSDLPPARELLGGLASVVGLTGADHGWADAPADDQAIRIAR
ncbi:GNAT family N-acetyltransferase [Gaiella sp.]|uniref:GNAT family N-acetyltransferase n=1 Tax=Gaiella sp. TaxID=2663207 RepID=UPI003983A0A5